MIPSLRNYIKHLFKKKVTQNTQASSIPNEPVLPNLPPEATISFDSGLLKGKKVLVTGAGENIGKSICKEMAAQGAQIYFTDIKAEKCLRLENEMLTNNIITRGFNLDCSNIDELDKLLSTLKKESIHIDILVNNVGMTPSIKPFRKIDISEWQQVFNTNVIGPSYLTKNIVQTMIENKIHGSIIFITSIHQQTIFGSSSYSSSKAALGMLIKELSMEFAKDNIRVNGIAPGWVVENEQQNSLYHELTPLHKCSINPRYIGRSAVYLASDYFSRFTTGAIVKIDGGLSLHSYLTTNQD